MKRCVRWKQNKVYRKIYVIRIQDMTFYVVTRSIEIKKKHNVIHIWQLKRDSAKGILSSIKK